MSKNVGFFVFCFVLKYVTLIYYVQRLKQVRQISKVMTLRNIDCYGNTASSSVIQCSSQCINDEVLFRSLNSVSICFSSSLFILKNVLDFNTTSSSCYNTNRISAFSPIFHLCSWEFVHISIFSGFHKKVDWTIMIIYLGNL